ncbi:GTP-dependent dephospho-CoA kinase family protein [Halobacteriaceae archaeon GCM10025711]
MAQDTVASLPASLRAEFKDPLGPVYTDATDLLADAGDPVVAVGDIVTYHLAQAGETPAVAVVDGRTERETVDPEVAAGLPDGPRVVSVANEPATLSAALVEALVDAIRADDPTRIVVDGEEDLATLPAIVAAPDGATVVYGQPGEGMVRVPVTDETRRTARDLLSRMETDDRLWTILDG